VHGSKAVGSQDRAGRLNLVPPRARNPAGWREPMGWAAGGWSS